MATRRTFPVVARAALLDELAARGIAPTLPDGTPRLQTDAVNAYVWCEDAELPTVAAAVAAHDPAALDAAAAQDVQRDRDARALLRAVADGTASLAQKNQALQVLCGLVLRRLP